MRPALGGGLAAPLPVLTPRRTGERGAGQACSPSPWSQAGARGWVNTLYTQKAMDVLLNMANILSNDDSLKSYLLQVINNLKFKY